jgi:Tol biopolymer transport system component
VQAGQPVSGASVPRYSIEEFMATTRIAGASFSPDGRKLLFSSNQTGIFNVFEVPAEGGTPVQLTHSTDDAIFLRGYFPGRRALSLFARRGRQRAEPRLRARTRRQHP